jgi:hypothetical protein
MKNIHVLPTDKPSRLADIEGLLVFGDDLISPIGHPTMFLYRHIYITSDEEIKEGDWFFNGEHILQCSDVTDIIIDTEGQWSTIEDCKKIILTTDQDLIKDGVQVIDDEFLEWFVKNPSCELVPIANEWKEKYKIIIPKEEPKQCKCGSNWVNTTNKDNPFCFHCGKPLTQEPKQETLEEAMMQNGYHDSDYDKIWREGVQFGAKWQAERMGLMEIELRHTKTLLASCEKALEDRDKQAERMYSEEEVLTILKSDKEFIVKELKGLSPFKNEKEWFEHFKK